MYYIVYSKPIMKQSILFIYSCNNNNFSKGFSLGGNVALKYVGEQGTNAWRKNIKGCVVTSVPFDAVASQGKIDVGVNRELYSRVKLVLVQMS